MSDQHRRASRMFAWLMVIQWFAAIGAAIVISPNTWIGDHDMVAQHIWLAVVLGGVLAALPTGMAIAMPNSTLTRHVVAGAQMMFSALLIHLTGGRIETHFHVFGSIALLSYYRDWRVLFTATVVITLDHALRGAYAPLSVFGAVDASRWRWLEHTAWVLFEDAFLIASCVRGIAERHEIAARQANLEGAKAATEREVNDRTRDLAHAATHDKLTGLPNRSVLRDRLGRVVTPAGAAEPFALFFLDFDRFKVVNDSLGHDAGDQLLIEIARRLTVALESPQCRSRCREALAARMGGDEFVVFLEGISDSEQAETVAKFLLASLSAPHRLKGFNFSSTASIGVTTSELRYTDPADVLRDADNAMYHAKALGKARHVLFDRKMHQAAKDRLVLENELRGAAARDEMVLHYQPLVNTEDGALRGFEALIRWNHPTRGLVPPEEFISCAEETGIIDELGTWALREACLQLQRWRVKFPTSAHLVMSVNVSPRQLVSRQIFEQVRTVLTQTGADPARLALEITESAVIADPEYTIDLLKQLKLLGVRVYLDDFGTGSTSLSYLHRLPVDGLKMDRSFMRSVGERRDYAAIVHAIVSLAQNLGIHVIAEGIESEPQLVMLQTMGCTCGQGYYFGRAADAKGVEKYFAHTWGGNWAQAA